MSLLFDTYKYKLDDYINDELFLEFVDLIHPKNKIFHIFFKL